MPLNRGNVTFCKDSRRVYYYRFLSIISYSKLHFYVPDKGIYEFSFLPEFMLRFSGLPFRVLDLNRLPNLFGSFEVYDVNSVVTGFGLLVVDLDLE